MIPRYTRPEMGQIWSDENKFRTWLQVEVAASETLAEAGIVPKSAARAIRVKGAAFEVARIHQVEAEVKHDVIAFTTAVAEKVGPESRWLHYGLTSNDVVDTAQALLVQQASVLLRADIEKFLVVLQRRALEFQHTPQIGRTHGVHAEPITFGLKIANWFSEMQRNLERFDLATEQMRVGKLSGAVGNGAHLDPKYEELICKRLGLAPAAVSSQVIQRDRHAFYVATLAVVACTLDKIATEDPASAEDRGARGRRVSSAKSRRALRRCRTSGIRSPANRSPGLSRVIRGNVQPAFEDVALWHERDISHSSVERVILPDSTILLDYLLAKTTNLVDTLLVYPERMLRNLHSTGGLVFSGQLLLDLVEAGVLREDAYRIVQRNAMQAWREEKNFRELVSADPEITSRVEKKTLDRAFDLNRQLRNVDKIFKRVFPRSEIGSVGKPHRILVSKTKKST